MYGVPPAFWDGRLQPLRMLGKVVEKLLHKILRRAATSAGIGS